MAWLAVAALVVVVHLATGIGAWVGVGLLADDHEMIGAAILRHRGDWTLASAFLLSPMAEAHRALYRPFVDLLFWLEYPWFGVEAFGYHVVNSALHCSTALLWGSLIRRLTGASVAGLATAVLFVGWPGHSEATHWLAARTNLLSVFFMAAALLVLDRALLADGRGRRFLLQAAAVALAVLGVGSKESAVFVVPLAAVLCWLRSDGELRPRTRRALLQFVPIAVAVLAWLWWRAQCLGTWGSGTHYGWRLSRVDAESCRDWLSVLLAPVHLAYLPAWWLAALAALHVFLGTLALAGLRHAAVRRALAVAGCLIALGYLAGIGLEPLHVDVLQNVRYSYEPALGVCTVLGVAIALVPQHWRGLVLAAVVVVHAWVLTHNRESWLRAASVYARMQEQVLERARSTQQPVRVFDAPGVYDGAFAYLNGYTEFLFWQQSAAVGTNLRGGVASTQEWRAVLQELAAAAAAGRPLEALVVRWDDGALSPFALDRQWPASPFDGVEILYARTARLRPFVGTELPVQVLVRTSRPIELGVGDVMIAVEPSEQPVAVMLSVPLPVHVGTELPIELRVRAADREHIYDLGVVRAQPRS